MMQMRRAGFGGLIVRGRYKILTKSRTICRTGNWAWEPFHDHSDTPQLSGRDDGACRRGPFADARTCSGTEDLPRAARRLHDLPEPAGEELAGRPQERRGPGPRLPYQGAAGHR